MAEELREKQKSSNSNETYGCLGRWGDGSSKGRMKQEKKRIGIKHKWYSHIYKHLFSTVYSNRIENKRT